MKKIILSLLLSLLSFSSIYACSCQGILSFCSLNTNHPNMSVFIGEIMRHDSLFTEFKIIHKLRGSETRTLVKIYDNPSSFNSCVGPYEVESRVLGNVGDSILVMVSDVDTTNANNNWGTLGDYYRDLGICSSPIIPVVNGALKGLITGSSNHFPLRSDSIPISQFVTNYAANSTSNDCDIFLGITKVNLNSFKVSPNPTKDIIGISLDNIAQITKTELYAIDGKLLRSDFSYVNQISLREFPNGIYFVQLELKNGERISKKVIKH